jgi:hypothetical protein
LVDDVSVYFVERPSCRKVNQQGPMKKQRKYDVIESNANQRRKRISVKLKRGLVV